MPLNASKQSHDWLCVGQEDWDDVWRRNQFLIAGLLRAGSVHRVLFVELPCDLSHGLLTRNIFVRDSAVRAKLRNARLGLRRCQDTPGVVLLTPVKLLPNRYSWFRHVNEWLQRFTVKRALRSAGMVPSVFWTQNPDAVHWLDHMEISQVVYDATDDWSRANGSPRARKGIADRQAEFARRSSLVLACSYVLFEMWKQLNLHTYPLPNGVDISHFNSDLSLQAPAEITRLTGPRLGYTGTLHDERINLDLVVRVATIRPHWQLIFVGPDELSATAHARLSVLANVHILGSRKYVDLPSYLRCFDLCIIPHRVTPFTESLNPIKIYEYMATGLPIVSTPVATVRELGDLVYLAGDAEIFVKQVERALLESNDTLPGRRRAYAAENSWSQRVATITALLQKPFATPTLGSAVANHQNSSPS